MAYPSFSRQTAKTASLDRRRPNAESRNRARVGRQRGKIVQPRTRRKRALRRLAEPAACDERGCRIRSSGENTKRDSSGPRHRRRRNRRMKANFYATELRFLKSIFSKHPCCRQPIPASQPRLPVNILGLSSRHFDPSLALRFLRFLLFKTCLH